jgi:hypothetical protein
MSGIPFSIGRVSDIGLLFTGAIRVRILSRAGARVHSSSLQMRRRKLVHATVAGGERIRERRGMAVASLRTTTTAPAA